MKYVYSVSPREREAVVVERKTPAWQTPAPKRHLVQSPSVWSRLFKRHLTK